jgi:hypothetical protein
MERLLHFPPSTATKMKIIRTATPSVRRMEKPSPKYLESYSQSLVTDIVTPGETSIREYQDMLGE